MIVLPDCIRVETDSELQFFFRFECSFGNFDLINSIFLDLVIIEMPVHIFFINIADGDSDIFWIASVRFCDDFSFEIDDGGFKEKLRVDAFTFY